MGGEANSGDLMERYLISFLFFHGFQEYAQNLCLIAKLFLDHKVWRVLIHPHSTIYSFTFFLLIHWHCLFIHSFVHSFAHPFPFFLFHRLFRRCTATLTHSCSTSWRRWTRAVAIWLATFQRSVHAQIILLFFFILCFKIRNPLCRKKTHKKNTTLHAF